MKFVEFSFSQFKARPNTCVLEGSWEAANGTGLPCQGHPRGNSDTTERLCQSGVLGRAAHNLMFIVFSSSPQHLLPAALVIKQRL